VTAPRASSSGGQVEPGGTPPAASLTAHACARHRGGGPPPRPTPASCTAPRHTARHACSCTVGLVRGNLLGVGLDSRWPAAAAVRCGGCTLPPCSGGSRPAQTDLSPATNRCFSTPKPNRCFSTPSLGLEAPIILGSWCLQGCTRPPSCSAVLLPSPLCHACAHM
jgi:hypothetical protein